MLLVTEDSAELRAHVRRLCDAGVDASLLRIDTLCGRQEYPSGYRLSRFITDPAVESDGGHVDS
ncbi:hypothetical protein ABZ747_35720 [Kitasatospora cineracea]|uniref:hypothetical protein n=1 Tax=Kitasatospora cineracea TaxID=88074 RepID=UPI0033E7FB79